MVEKVVYFCSRYNATEQELHAYLVACKSLNIKRVILRPAPLSRGGKYSFAEIDLQMELVSRYGMIPIVEWDILMEETRFQQVTAKLGEWLVTRDEYPIFRVQDFGALFWLKRYYPMVKIQLNLETGHRNFPAILGMVDFVGQQLDSVVLSFELTKDKLQEFCSKLSCSTEIFYFGKIPLFYSPRKLLSATNLGKAVEKNEEIVLLGKSEESPHTGFPLIQNQHGTFMYNVKDLSLLDVFDELLQQVQINYLRIDLSWYHFAEQIEWLQKIDAVEQGSYQYRDFKSEYPTDLIRGFYSANRSSILFEKLKNKHLLRDDQTYVGEVIEVLKGKHLALLLQRRGLSRGDMIFYITPEGKRIDTQLSRILNCDGQEVDCAEAGDLIFVTYQKSISTRSIVNLLLQ